MKTLRSGFRVAVWEERDRLQIVAWVQPIRYNVNAREYELDQNRAEKDVATWTDDDARSMFEDGFFQGGNRLEESVYRYLTQNGVLKEAKL